MWRIVKPTILAALVCAVLMGTSGQALAGCLAWSEAGPVIAKNGLVPAGAIYKKVQAKYPGGKIVKATLCQDGNRFLYRFVVVGAKGDVSNVAVDAKTGQF
jgi:uncharacterized membrane protein YkoI